MFVAKATVLFAFLVAVELVAVPAFALLLLGPGAGQALPELVAVLLLADAGSRSWGRWSARSASRPGRAT